MQIFISWSGSRSHGAARALRRLIADLFDDVQPWLSSSEIGAGERWSSAVGKALEESSFGILCCTEDNVVAPWLLFEAGALAKVLNDSLVVPFLVNVAPDELPGSVRQFQCVEATEDGTWELIKGINRQRQKARDTEQLRRQFERWWVDTEVALAELPKADAGFASPMQELLRYAREGATERALNSGMGLS